MPVSILIPTVGRAHRIPVITANVLESTDHANVYFICEREDEQSIKTVVQTVGANLIVNRRTKNYAGAINTGVAETDEPYLFTGADDLNFHPGWFETAVALMDKKIQVVGTNDLGNSEVLAGLHSTHSLVSRNYATQGVVDQLGSMLHEGYHHNWCDTEFIRTAMARGRFAPCLEAKVEHLHYVWGKAPMDDGYSKSFSQEPQDRALFREREQLWTSL
jgi:glycosyltransferase involved in cell wall biosynthesis